METAPPCTCTGTCTARAQAASVMWPWILCSRWLERAPLFRVPSLCFQPVARVFPSGQDQTRAWHDTGVFHPQRPDSGPLALLGTLTGWKWPTQPSHEGRGTHPADRGVFWAGSSGVLESYHFAGAALFKVSVF